MVVLIDTSGTESGRVERGGFLDISGKSKAALTFAVERDGVNFPVLLSGFKSGGKE